MPIHDFNVSDLQIWTADGIPIHFCNFADVQTFDDSGTQENSMTWSTISDSEATFTCSLEWVSRKLRNYLAYGWTARGPVRKRVLKKLRKKVLG